MLQIPSIVKSLGPLIQKVSVKEAKKKLIFHKLCKEINLELLEDSFDFIYLQALTIFLDNKHEDWAIIFNLKESKEIFDLCYKQRDFEEFERTLDAHLHTTIKKGDLKSLNEIPAGFVAEFKALFRELVYDNFTPTQTETINTVIDVSQKIENKIESSNERVLELLEKLNGNVASLTAGASTVNYEQILSSNHQFQIDQIKKIIEQGNMVTAYDQLLDLKEHIFPTASPETKLKTLNNIAFTLYHQNKPEDALAYYEESIKLVPDHEGTLAQLAGIYLSQKRIDEAFAVANRIQPARLGLLAAIELHRKSQLEIDFDPKAGLSASLLKDTDVLVALINVSIKKFPQKTISYARTLLTDDPNSQSYQEIFIHVICHVLVGEQIDFNATELKTESDRAQILEAAEMLKAMWKKFEGTDLKNHKLNLLEKLGLIYTVLTDHEASLTTADLLLSVDPNHQNAAKFRGMSLSYLHRYEEAVIQFEQLPENDDHAFDYINVWALCLALSNRHSEAFAMLDNFLLKPEEKKGDHERVRFMLQYLYRKGSQPQKALKVQEIMLEKNPENIAVLADRAKTFQALNDDNEVRNLVTRIIQLAKDPDKSFSGKERYLAAHYLYTIGKFQEAADVLESFVDVSRMHFLTYQLADSYMQSGRKGSALTIYKNLREKYGVHRDYSRKEADIYLFYHDYEAYEKLLESYIIQYPEDFAARLNLNSVHIRLDRKQKTKDFYSTLPDTNTVNFEEVTVLARQMHISDFHDVARGILYKYRRKNPGAEINDFYISFCLEKPDGANDLVIHKVEKNAVVSLKSGDIITHYTIEDLPEKELIKTAYEINLSDPIYLKLKGKKIGDKITNSHFSFGTTAEIVGLQHKYLFAFHQAGKENTTIFASQSAIKTVQFADIENFHEIIQQKVYTQGPTENAYDELESQYRAGIIPLTIFAYLTRRNPIEIFKYFTHSNIGIHYTVGHTKDYEEAVQLASTSNTFVFDITALLTLFELDVTKDHLNSLSRKVITHSTFDIVKEYVRQKESESQGPHVSFFQIKGEKYRQEITKEQKLKGLDKWKAFEYWVSDNFKMMPCKSLLEHENPKIQNFLDMIGLPAFESVLLAKELNGLWICDDTSTRTFFSEPYNCPGIWTQPLLRHLQINDSITQKEFSLNINRLCLLNYHFTTINKDDILICLEENNFTINQNTDACLRILSGKLSDANSVKIAFVVLQNLPQEKINSKARYELIYNILLTTLGYRYCRPTLEIFKDFTSLFIQGYNYQEEIYKAIRQLKSDIYG